ncbi:DNA oxidative demethylase AlkB [Dongia sp.]|uniref:DNA oxidative demethylase AlkB n=1 Tax=Dongia sp. TaxID=1977262 RepID=UPI00375192F6
MPDLFAERRETMAAGAVLLRGFALPRETALLAAIEAVAAEAPFRHMMTPGGYTMSVAMTTCGSVGWVTDRKGYRYSPTDPTTGRPWPPMPICFQSLAAEAAAEAGYRDFQPDSCLINRYEPGTKLSLHQDQDELDMSQPIVSVSLGLPATFLFGGAKRGDPTAKYPLVHGDVAVWGGPSRLTFHGVATLKDGNHPLLGEKRINLTFRRALG